MLHKINLQNTAIFDCIVILHERKTITTLKYVFVIHMSIE